MAKLVQPTHEVALTDDSIIQFGKYRGTRLGNVPASYLLWWWDQMGEGPLAEYVWKNLSSLEQDAPDVIVMRKSLAGRGQ